LDRGDVGRMRAAETEFSQSRNKDRERKTYKERDLQEELSDGKMKCDR